MNRGLTAQLLLPTGPLLTAYQVSRLDPTFLLPFAVWHHPGRGKEQNKMGGPPPSIVDSLDNLALHLKKHKALSCMSFWCFWIPSLWRWNNNHHQSCRVATGRKNRHIIKHTHSLVISPLLIQSLSANRRRESLHGYTARFAYNQVSKPALLRPFVQLQSLLDFFP